MSPSNEKPKKSKAKFYDPDTKLKEKVGTGTPFKKERVDKAQKFVDQNEVDFQPMAENLLKQMREDLDRAQAGKLSQAELVENLTQPVMELKANAATFKYPLISILMNILLNFLETLEELNDDSLNIAEVNYTTVKAVLAHELKDESDPRAQLFIKELQGAISRYRKKHPD